MSDDQITFSTNPKDWTGTPAPAINDRRYSACCGAPVAPAGHRYAGRCSQCGEVAHPVHIRRILLDMDGVLADWCGGVFELLGLEAADVFEVWPAGEWGVGAALEEFGHTTRDFWGRIDAAGREFWAELEELPWALELHETCQAIADTTILTSPSLDPGCAAGKVEWLQRFRGTSFRDYLIGADKSACAKSGHVLIDDKPANCTAFEEAGGDAVLFPARWNCHADHLDDPIGFVLEELDRINQQLEW